MIRKFVILCVLLGCQPQPPPPAAKPVYTNIPQNLRKSNFGGGSCVHASMITCLKWQHINISWPYSGSCGSGELISLCRSRHLKVAYTLKGDPKFLDWCNRTRRAAVIFYYSDHCVTFCGYVNNSARLLDNNTTNQYNYIPRSIFLKDWLAYGGFALTPVYSPTPPRPYVQ